MISDFVLCNLFIHIRGMKKQTHSYSNIQNMDKSWCKVDEFVYLRMNLFYV